VKFRASQRITNPNVLQNANLKLKEMRNKNTF